MAIQFYHTSDDKAVVNKTITPVGESMDVAYMDETNVEKPSYRLGFVPNLPGANYLYDSTTNRYYFVNSPIYEPGGSIIYPCEEDCLMSHKDDILNLVCTIARNENESDAYLPDAGYKTKAYQNIVTKPFPNAMTEDTVILMTLG